MSKQRKTNLLLVLAMVFVAMFSCMFGVVTLTEGKQVNASAETIDYVDELKITDATNAWAPGGDEYILLASIKSGNGVTGAWNVTWDSSYAQAFIAANGGVDIMEYILINGESARESSTKNGNGQTQYKGTSGWLANGGVCAPVFVETTTSEGIVIRILKAYTTNDSFRLTFKAGFRLLDSNNNVITLSKDVHFVYAAGTISQVQEYTLSFEGFEETKTIMAGEAIGALPEIPEKDGCTGAWTIDGVAITADTLYTYGANKTAVITYAEKVDVTASVKIEFASFKTVESAFKIFIEPAGTLTTNAWWNIPSQRDMLITANNGVDIMEYIYINGQSARALSDDNRTNNTYPQGEATGWFTNSDQCRPVFVETTSDGIWVRVMHAFSTENYTVTLKAGFEVLTADGNTSVISEDVEFICTNGGGVQRVVYCDLAFEGTEIVKTVKAGAAIGELPAVPARDGFVGFWAIDGKPINENSVIAENKTATLVYALEYDAILGLENRDWGADAGEYYFGGINLTGGYFNTADSVSSTWYVGNNDIIAANNGVDIMEYIYVNGKSARQLITENANGERLSNTCGCWLSNPAAYPVYVETTNGSGIIIRVAQAYAGDTVTITFKAGFSLIRNDGQLVYVSNDINYTFANNTLTDESRCSVLFDGENAQYVRKGGVLVAPAAPTKEETESHTYEFDGWYNGETKWDFTAPVEENMALVAKFNEIEKEKFEVTFNADNGTDNTAVSVYVGASVKEEQIPADPVKAADGNSTYSFLYWSLDGETAYDFATPVTGAITLTAIYTTKPIYYVTMGDATVKVAEGGKVEKPADPTQESTAEYDYTFVAWYNGETEWNFDTDVVTTDITLTAKFNAIKRSYTITFNVTGNEAVSFEAVTLEYGASYDLSNLLEGVDVSAYTYTVTVNGEAVTSVVVLGNVTVDVAFVARVYYTVSIDGVEQTVEEGAKAVMPETAPTKEATAEFTYTFDGWYNGETKWNFDTDVVTADLELTAKFVESKRTYTITFNVTGNDAITLDAVTVEYGTVYDLSKLLEGKDVSGYGYSISIGGVEKASFKVIADTTVDVTFTAKADANQSEGGCMGTVGGAGALLCAMALGVVAVFKKKED